LTSADRGPTLRLEPRDPIEETPAMTGPLALALVVLLAGAGDDPPIDRMVGHRAEAFTLEDATTGKPLALDDLKDNKAVVLVFTGTNCPIGNKSIGRLVELSEHYKGRGVAVLGINANASETAADIAAHAKEYGVSFPVLRDADGRVARMLQAERTCEALVLDADRTIRYRGAIDDQFTYRAAKDEPDHRYLRDAIDAVLAGRAVEPEATAVVGCPIERAGP
jgi:peroxiredoxin